MNLVLIGFSQDVDFENLSETFNFLKFRRPDGSELRLPVPEETIRALVSESVSTHQRTVSAKESEPADPEPQQEMGPEIDEVVEDDDDGTQFGGSESPPDDLGVRGQIELTEKDLIESGIDPATYKSPKPKLRAVPPPKARRQDEPRNERRLIPNLGDDGVPAL